MAVFVSLQQTADTTHTHLLFLLLLFLLTSFFCFRSITRSSHLLTFFLSFPIVYPQLSPSFRPSTVLVLSDCCSSYYSLLVLTGLPRRKCRVIGFERFAWPWDPAICCVWSTSSCGAILQQLGLKRTAGRRHLQESGARRWVASTRNKKALTSICSGWCKSKNDTTHCHCSQITVYWSSMHLKVLGNVFKLAW